jgi:hypothetical protein
MLSPRQVLLTLNRPPLYIRAMNADQTNHRFDLELRRLEKRLES